jgi:hypothetical protein
MKTTIDMAREVKMPYDFETGEPINIEKLKAFEALVRADEREACAKACEDLEVWNMDDPGSSAAKVIRSRNNK